MTLEAASNWLNSDDNVCELKSLHVCVNNIEGPIVEAEPFCAGMLRVICEM